MDAQGTQTELPPEVEAPSPEPPEGVVPDPSASPGAESDPPAESSPTGERVASADPDEAEMPEVPAWVITCPTCNTSIPFVPGIEGYEPSMSKSLTTCPDCDGMGEVKTGSLVAEHAVVKCDRCTALGYIAKDGTAPPTVLEHGKPPWEGAKWNVELGTWV